MHNNQTPRPWSNNMGFTLIELVVVIIIIGTLAIVAAPKFINLQKEAKISVLLAAKSSLHTANQLVQIKAKLQGQDKIDATTFNIDTDSDGIKDVIGHFGLIKYVISARELSGLNNELMISKHYGGSANGLPYFLIYFADSTPSASNQCFVEVYYPNQGNGNIRYQLVDQDC